MSKTHPVKPILVIGSAHLDIIVQVVPNTKKHLDRIGRLCYAVGGTAFNVAANLAYHRKPVALYSVLKRGSLSVPIIRAELARRGMADALVCEDPRMPESGFVAHIEDKAITTAVSCVGIEDVSFDKTVLSRAIENSSLVAIECNLSVRQIQQVLEIAKSKGRAVCISAVSESKVERMQDAVTSGASPAFLFAIMNELEAQKVLGKSFGDHKLECEAFSSEYVVITQGERGFTVVGARGKRWKFATKTADVCSSFGAGDALFSAFCSHFSRRSKLAVGDIERDATRFLIPVLKSRFSIPELATRP